jgi:hypothetical protein
MKQVGGNEYRPQLRKYRGKRISPRGNNLRRDKGLNSIGLVQ